nr:phosphoribosylformylglycinamidine synthase subunit PurQ [Deltaproteobacteria bacterium]
HDGNYFATPEIIGDLNKNDKIIFKYCEPDGELTDNSNPNGSLYNIAGISNKKFNVMGLMPHPERSSEKLLGSEDGGYIFKSIIKYIREK